MEKRRSIFQVILVIFAFILLFILVYSPHFSYRFPFHVDEWGGILKSMLLADGLYLYGFAGAEMGFHFFLLILSKFFNLVLIYKFLPAIWAVLSASALFYTSYKLTDDNFWIALLSVIFFASIKSNVNLTGLWFFTPLTFSIPFIFLYIYFFSQGIQKQNKKFILISLAIMTFLLFFHAISVLFAVPFLVIYALINFNYIKKEYKFFSLFLIIPIAGILFYKYIIMVSWSSILSQYIIMVSWSSILSHLVTSLQFRQGWGIGELQNLPTEVYSLIGYLFALFGMLIILLYSKNIRKYLVYVLWPAMAMISMLGYKLTGVSYLVPYQRNLYYLAISIPFLSAFGIYYLLKLISAYAGNLRISEKSRALLKYAIIAIIVVIVLFFAFKPYYSSDRRTQLYQLINDKDYKDLIFLSSLQTIEKERVIAPIEISTAMYPISQKIPLSTLNIYTKLSHKEDLELFFELKDCDKKQEIIQKDNVRYVLSKEKIDCGWKRVYSENNYIYEVK
ncbi:MAG: hypothetical protein KKA64_02135 [Nanoarchaeota archaeon]|nr:hypothetical protein [Nanoarchaeota archaeon]